MRQNGRLVLGRSLVDRIVNLLLLEDGGKESNVVPGQVPRNRCAVRQISVSHHQPICVLVVVIVAYVVVVVVVVLLVVTIVSLVIVTVTVTVTIVAVVVLVLVAIVVVVLLVVSIIGVIFVVFVLVTIVVLLLVIVLVVGIVFSFVLALVGLVRVRIEEIVGSIRNLEPPDRFWLVSMDSDLLGNLEQDGGLVLGREPSGRGRRLEASCGGKQIRVLHVVNHHVLVLGHVSRHGGVNYASIQERSVRRRVNTIVQKELRPQVNGTFLIDSQVRVSDGSNVGVVEPTNALVQILFVDLCSFHDESGESCHVLESSGANTG
mmetsp:Transcript_6508/g.18667  ORF Transcript_6508/g.18667 Transcript_6508/m.18667 type:complete len:319 (+) Transcript_6508:783-1739(+)